MLFRSIHLRLAEYYEKNNLIIEALHHYNFSQNPEKAAQALNKVIKDVHSREMVLKERNWVFDLPTDALKEHPWLLIYKGRISEYSGDYKKASNNYQSALEIMTDISDNYGIMMAHYYIAKITQLTKVGDSIENLECAKKYAILLKDDFMYSLILRKIASENRINGNFDIAMTNLKKAIEITTSINNEIGLSLCFHTMGNLYRSMFDFENSIECYDKAIVIRESQGDRYGKAKSLNNKAVALKELGNFKLAEQLFNQSFSIKDELNDDFGKCLTLDYMGEMYLSMDNLDQAFTVYNKSLRIKEAIGGNDIYGVTKNKIFIGEIYNERGEWKKALELLDYAKMVSMDNNMKSLSATSKLFIADAKSMIGEYDLSLNIYYEALNEFKRLSLYNRIVECGVKIINLLLRQKKYQEASGLYAEIKSILGEKKSAVKPATLKLKGISLEILRGNILGAEKDLSDFKGANENESTVTAEYFLVKSEYCRSTLAIEDAISYIKKAINIFKILRKEFRIFLASERLVKSYIVLDKIDEFRQEYENYSGIAQRFGFKKISF